MGEIHHEKKTIMNHLNGSSPAKRKTRIKKNRNGSNEGNSKKKNQEWLELGQGQGKSPYMGNLDLTKLPTTSLANSLAGLTVASGPDVHSEEQHLVIEFV
jgi:hypothetical protein